MDQQQSNISNRLRSKVTSFSVDKDELKKFCLLLQERYSGAAEYETSKFDRGDKTEEEYQAALKSLRDGFELRVQVNGKNGEELYGRISDVYDSVNFPGDIKSIFVDSAHLLRDRHNYYPRNSFKIFLDFSKPSIFDFSFMPSQSTPNESNYEVQGLDSTWVNGVFSEISNFIRVRSSTLSVVHVHSVYDIMLLFLGFPLALWTCYKVNQPLEAIPNIFLRNAVYVYLFVLLLNIFRIIFHYIRWVCPLVEYRCGRNRIIAHRIFLSAILASIFGALIYDISRVIFS